MFAFSLALPSMRLMTAMHFVVRLINTWVRLIPQITSLLIMLVTFLYCWSVVGVEIFHPSAERVAGDVSEGMLKLKEAGFDTRYASLINVPQAMLLLIQVLRQRGVWTRCSGRTST